MILKNLPENPQERKVIVLIDKVDIIDSYKSEWIKSEHSGFGISL